jgi:hypothetical protein
MFGRLIVVKHQKETTFDLMFWLLNKEITLPQFRARMKDLGLTEEEIDGYLDGDAADMDEDQLEDLRHDDN